ncbi:glycosyltransferase [Bizionia sp.]|uniref:glycosyltransferase n=1 Tax=Bizionia sp. TaxID=1954480 RepID=UPI003A8DB95B
MNKKIIIISPINRYGGVNMDVAFLSQFLGYSNNIKVISLSKYYTDSSVYYFEKELDYTSIDKIVYALNWKIRFLTKLVSFFKPLPIPNHFRINNFLTKFKLLNLDGIKLKHLFEEVDKSEVVLVCSQLTAKYNAEIINHAYSKRKTVLLKVTGQINNDNFNNSTINWLKKVNLFIFHSYSNQKMIEDYVEKNKCQIIDQHSYLEDKLLNIPIKTDKTTRFFTLSRLHSIKQIEKVIDVFNSMEETNLILNIYGDGSQETDLKERSKNKNIKFHGKVDYKLIPKIFKNNDCLIISSIVEAGPYTGIESMASGTPIISTIVGAMEERLGTDYPYFYDGTEKDLTKKINAISSLNKKEIVFLSKKMREIYKKNYTGEIVKKKYNSVFAKFTLF